MKDVQLIHPVTVDQCRRRDLLLQQTLREPPEIFPINREYPLVLSRRASRYSYCLELGSSQPAAHLNLWPRSVVGEASLPLAGRRIGLVGNVCVQPELQGQGWSRRLFEQVEPQAQALGLEGLLLWSEKQSYYEKLGFFSVGCEQHLLFSRKDLVQQSADRRASCCPAGAWLQEDSSAVSLLLADMWKLRLPVRLWLERSLDEFRQLLDIPLVTLSLVFSDSHELLGYAFCGKGHDMVGVVHEWGAVNSTVLNSLLVALCEHLKIEQVLVLCPSDAAVAGEGSRGLLRDLRLGARSVTEQAMAIFKPLVARPSSANKKGYVDWQRAWSEAFVWGFDSI